MRCQNAGLLSVNLSAVETELITKLGDLIGELIERRERILNLSVGKTRVCEVVDELLILLFKLGQGFVRGFGIVCSAVIEPVKLVYCLIDGVLKLDKHIINFFVYERKILFCVLNIHDLLGDVYSLVADEVDRVVEGVVRALEGVDKCIVRGDELIDSPAVADEVVVYLLERVLEHLGRGIALNVGGEGVELVKQRFQNGGNVLFVDYFLDLITGRLYDLDGDGIGLLVLIEFYRRLVHIRVQEIVHIICKVGLDDNCGVVLSRIEILYGLVGIVEENKAKVFVVLNLVNQSLAHIDNVALGIHIVLIVGNDGNGNVPGFAVRIPKRIDVEPCIQGWQNKDRQYDEESEEILIQVPQVIFKNPENITHIGQYSCQT